MNVGAPFDGKGIEFIYSIPDRREEGHRYFVLAILLLVYILNSVDRSIVSILGQPIKEDLKLDDWQLGLMSGFGFTLLYVMFGFPLARLADRGNRVSILSACVFVWSVMTALCGMGANFIQLLLARAGVGAGEAGCLPPSHSLIGDYFPANRRATALAIFGLGLPLGGLIGIVLGGVIVDLWGWRHAFIVIGLGGLPLAIALKIFVKEPVRGRFEQSAGAAVDLTSSLTLKDCLLHHARSRLSRNILLAMTLLMTFSGPYVVFLAPYMVRKFALSYSDLGLILALSMMIGAAISTLLGGFLADKLGARDRRWYMILPAICSTLSGTFYFLTFLQQSVTSFSVLLFFAALAGGTYLAPCYAILHNNAPPQMRATTTAIVQFCMSFIGLGVGPLFAGLSIDILSAYYFDGLSNAGQFSTVCPGGAALPGSSAALVNACHMALTTATQTTLACSAALVVWPAVHLARAARALGRQE